MEHTLLSFCYCISSFSISLGSRCSKDMMYGLFKSDSSVAYCTFHSQYTYRFINSTHVVLRHHANTSQPQRYQSKPNTLCGTYDSSKYAISSTESFILSDDTASSRCCIFETPDTHKAAEETGNATVAFSLHLKRLRYLNTQSNENSLPPYQSQGPRLLACAATTPTQSGRRMCPSLMRAS